MNKIYSLQDLRGVAILMVVLFHCGSTVFGDYNLFMYGNNGVLLFFMLSGFIISSVHKSDSGASAALLFSIKRVVRIYPPYIPVFIFFVFAFYVTGKGDWYHHDIINILENTFLMHDPRHQIHPYSWTLVHEMFYYITFCIFYLISGLFYMQS